jgi:hypothetical protein
MPHARSGSDADLCLSLSLSCTGGQEELYNISYKAVSAHDPCMKTRFAALTANRYDSHISCTCRVCDANYGLGCFLLPPPLTESHGPSVRSSRLSRCFVAETDGACAQRRSCSSSSGTAAPYAHLSRDVVPTQSCTRHQPCLTFCVVCSSSTPWA